MAFQFFPLYSLLSFSLNFFFRMKKTFVSLLLLFATFGAHGQEDDTSSSICAAEGEWKTNMCAKIIDFYGDVTCRKKLLVVQEDGSTIDIVETITTLFAENLELKNRLAAVECTRCIPDAQLAHLRRRMFSGSPTDGECTTWASYVWNVSNTHGTMPNWDTLLVTDMSGFSPSDDVYQGFGGQGTFNGDLSRWDTSHVTDMIYMFHNATLFNGDISKWETLEVQNMQSMFENASAFNQNIGGGTRRKLLTCGKCLLLLLIFFKIFPRGPDPQRRRRSPICSLVQLRSKANSRAPTPSPVRRVRAKVLHRFRTRVGILSSRSVWLNLQ